MTNETCVEYSMGPRKYKVFNTRSHEISGRKFLSRLIHARTHNTGDMNGDFQYELSTLALNNGEKLGNFNIRMIILQQEIKLSG